MKISKQDIVQACRSDEGCQSVGQMVALQVGADAKPPA